MLSTTLRETEETGNLEVQSEDSATNGSSEELWRPVCEFSQVAQDEIAVGFQCWVTLYFRHVLWI